MSPDTFACGHPRVDANTYRDGSSSRCRTCVRNRTRAQDKRLFIKARAVSRAKAVNP